jgi:ribonuclease D
MMAIPLRIHTMLITDSHILRETCTALAASPILFVDTEFLRERTYYSKLCLVQICGVEGEAFAVDALSDGIDLSPLWNLLLSPTHIKVMHAGRQDMELFYQHTGALPQPFFDTQIAAMFLGLGEQVGYDGLIRHFLGIPVCKAQQFTNWARRPLSEEQLTYALDDVRHLRDCYPLMRAALNGLGRTAWVEEETAYLLEPSLYVTVPDEAWLKIRKRDMRPRYLARLRALAAWREREAMARDLPRGTVVHDDTLQEIALTNPKSLGEMQRVRGIPKHSERVEALFAALNHANALPNEECPAVERRAAPAKEDDMLRDALRLLLKCKAREHNISAGALCDGEGIQQLIDRDATCPSLQSWRREMFGNAALAMLSGTLSVQIRGRDVWCEVI